MASHLGPPSSHAPRSRRRFSHHVVRMTRTPSTGLCKDLPLRRHHARGPPARPPRGVLRHTLPRRVRGPSSWFLPTSTASASGRSAGLLHPTADPEVHRVAAPAVPSPPGVVGLERSLRCLALQSLPLPRSRADVATGPCPLAVAGCHPPTSRPCSTRESVASRRRGRLRSARCSPGLPSPGATRRSSLCSLPSPARARLRPRRWLVRQARCPASPPRLAAGVRFVLAARTSGPCRGRRPGASSRRVRRPGLPRRRPFGAPRVQPASPRTSLDRAVVCARGRSLAPRRPVPPDGGPPVRGRPRSALRGRSPVASPGRSPGRAARLHRLATRSPWPGGPHPTPRQRRLRSAPSARRRACFEGRLAVDGSDLSTARPEGRATAASLDRRRRRQGSRTAACFAGGRRRPLRRPPCPRPEGGTARRPRRDRRACSATSPEGSVVAVGTPWVAGLPLGRLAPPVGRVRAPRPSSAPRRDLRTEVRSPP